MLKNVPMTKSDVPVPLNYDAPLNFLPNLRGAWGRKTGLYAY